MNIDYKELLSLRYYSKLIPNEIYFTSKGVFRAITKSRYTEYLLPTNNITGLTKNSVGLGNVDNTSDLNKPISIPTQQFLISNYYPLSNPAGYISFISGANVISALGYTPYDSSNPAGYITGVTPAQIVSALGYTPLDKAGDTMIGNLILNADPTNALGAVTKQYVDNIVVGLNFHEPVHAATTSDLSATYLNGTAGVGATLTATSNGALIVDGHTLLINERVMVWQQTNATENGIYNVTQTGSPSDPFILTRSADADNSPTGELAYGDFCFVQQGTLYGGYGFIMNTSGSITIGTTNISYVQFNAAQSVAAGYGLQELTPNVISADTSILATVASLGSYLTSAAAALTYYPLTNPAGYIDSSALTPYLTSALAALTYYPITNPSGYITGITSGDVTTALGYTPYNSTNPNGYITGVSSGDITGALGYTPVTDARNINTTAPLTGGGNLSADRTLSITQATTSTDGYLSSTDWNTFNNKSKQHFDNSTGTQSIPANTVTYITDSHISTASIKAGTVITWNISVTKTAAGTAAPAWTVKFGTAISTADTTILTFTGAAQTAAVDTGMFTIQCIFRTVGSGTSAVLVGHYSLVHQLDQTGLSTGNGGAFATSAGFNSTTANAFLGVTVNSGASAVWTVNQVFVKMENTL